MRQSFFDYCRQYHKEALLREWDTARNAPLTPQAVTYGSHTPVWWRCENGHEWEAVVYTRTHGSGCPFCAGKKAQAGFNDLATQYPELARQWDYTKNIPVLPADVTTGSHRLVWWKCEKGHSCEHLSAHAYLAMAARYALGGSFLQEKTIWQPGSRNWHRNGIGRKTAR